MSMGHHDQEPMSDINVTPLVDVMLVLLIIFMITAPMMTQGVDVELPKAGAPAMQQQIEPLVVSIKKDGKIYIKDRLVALEELAPRILAIHKNKEDLSIFIRGDAQTPYKHIAQVMASLAKADIRKVSLVTKPGK